MHDSLTWVFNENSDFGVAAPWTDGLKNRETIVKVPKSLILSPQTVSNPEFRKILLENTKLDPMCKLAIAYIFESCLREMSPFFGYLSYITFPDVPRLWDDDELELLHGTEAEIPYEKSRVYPSQFETKRRDTWMTSLEQRCHLFCGSTVICFIRVSPI
jgi:hypothetical protein